MHPEQRQIYWYSGLYLQPQHFQSLDLYHNYMHAQQCQLAQPWNFGVIQCDINQEALVDCSVIIEHLRLILPSGCYLEYPGNCVIEPRQFRDIWKQRERPFILWLALRRFDPKHSNLGTGTSSRWLNHGEEGVMKDVYGNGPDSEVPRIVYNISILSEEEKDAVLDCECIPLLQLRYDYDRIVSDPAFSPPCVMLAGSPALRKILDGLYAELSSRAHKFEEYKSSIHLKYDDKKFGDLTALLAIRSLSRTLPLLRHYIKTPMIHPWVIYGTLLQLIGELSAFNNMCSFTGEWRDGHPAPLPYDHYRLIECFNSVKNNLIILLNGLILEENTYVTLESDEKGFYFSELLPHLFQRGGAVLLLLRSEVLGAENVIYPSSSDFKVAARESISTLIHHALPGVPCNWRNPSPRGVPNRKDTFYFELNKHTASWEDVEKKQNVGFYWADAPDDLCVQLVFMEQS